MNQTKKFRYEWEWSSIHWKEVEKAIFKLQKRIYRASQRGEQVLVRKLQRLLLSSFQAKLLAVRRVTQDNRGKKTAGVDGKTALTSKQRQQLVKTLKLDTKVMPIRRVWIDKPGKKEKRPLGIPTISERAKQALVKMALEPEWEAKFEANSYGFRPGRSCHDAIQAIFNALKIKQAYVLDADIAGCFDNIDHQALLAKLHTSPKLKQIIKAWLKAGILDQGALQENKQGTPQGGVLSPLLANIALHGLEEDTKLTLKEDLRAYAKQKWGKAGKWQSMLSVIRYADDFLLIHENKEILLKAKDFVTEWLKKMGLAFKQQKTRICHSYHAMEHTKAGFTFLGFDIRQFRSHISKKGYKVIIKPSKESQKRHLHQLKLQLRKLRGVTQEKVITILNPMIRGWSNYYQYVVAREIFEKMAHKTFGKLWQWAKHRHPRKGKHWIKDKYFLQHEGNHWCFKTQRKMLSMHTDRKITRFVKVMEKKSPYDGDFIYWSTRRGRYPEGSQRASVLLKKQKGKCGKCGLYFKAEDRLETHHVNENPKDNRLKNLLLLHGHCHDYVHSREVGTVKHQIDEEPDDVKMSSPVLKPSASGDTRT